MSGRDPALLEEYGRHGSIGSSFLEYLSLKPQIWTNFTATIGTWFCEDGEYDHPGNLGDFPSGEVGFGPKVGSVNGTLVYDLKVQHVGILDSPLTCHVKQDRIVECSGSHRDEFLRICEQRGEILRYISEISLGMNPAGVLTRVAQFIPEEKNYGTLHCGHGGNASLLSYPERSPACRRGTGEFN